MRPRGLVLVLVPALLIVTAADVFFVLRRRASEPGADTIKAVAAYPLSATSTALAQVDGTGRITICHRGGASLDVGDVTVGRVVVIDSDVKALPLPCVGKAPETLVRIRDLLGRAPRRGFESVTRALVSPDGKRIAFELQGCAAAGGCTSRIYAMSLPGGRPERIGERHLIAWADAGHIVSGLGLIDPVAIDVETKAQRFLAFPRAWLGKLTPDGRRGFYGLGRPSARLRGLFESGTFEVDRVNGSQRSVTLPSGALNGAPDRTGDRFVELFGDNTASGAAQIRVYGRGAGLLKVHSSPVPRSESCDPDLGWFDASRAWIFDACGAALVDLDSGRATRLRIPELGVQGREEPETTFVSLYERVASALKDPSVQGPAAHVLSSAVPGATLTLPPSWKAAPCTCGPRPYPQAFLVAGDAPIVSRGGIGIELTIAVSPLGTTAVLAALREAYSEGRSPPGMRGRPIDSVATRAQRVGNIGVTALDLRSGRGAAATTDTILVGRMGSRTYIITVYGEGRDDPSVRFILDAIRFT